MAPLLLSLAGDEARTDPGAGIGSGRQPGAGSCWPGLGASPQNDTHRPQVLPIPGHAGRRRPGSPRPSCWLASGVTLHVMSRSAGATRGEEGGSESYRGQEPRSPGK